MHTQVQEPPPFQETHFNLLVDTLKIQDQLSHRCHSATFWNKLKGTRPCCWFLQSLWSTFYSCPYKVQLGCQYLSPTYTSPVSAR